MQIAKWDTPKTLPKLKVDEIHVWCANLQRPSIELNELKVLLTQDEIDRANRFKFAKHQQHFIAARGILRRILASYLNISAEQIRFTYGKQGKPRLADEHVSNQITFNISHSHELAVYAITQQGLIGIDIEWLRDDLASDELAQRFFAPGEYQQLQNVQASEKTLAFFYGWTRKEAFIKALGEGLTFPLADFEVTLDANDARLLTIKNDTANVSTWQLYSFLPAENYVSALAVQSNIKNIKFWQW